MTVAIETAQQILTVEEYLKLEEQALEKHEYHSGKLITMAGGTPYHSIISILIATSLKIALSASGLKNAVIGSDAKIWIPANKRFVYPDAAIIEIPPAFHPHKKGGIANPLLIAEVLSEHTEAYDRGEKFKKYSTIPSFLEYVLVSQDQPKIEVFYRKSAGSDWWQIQTFTDMAASVPLQSIGCEIKLSDVFEGVEFEEQKEVPGEEAK